MLSGHAEFAGLAEALSTTESPVSVRLNTAKGCCPAAGADTMPWGPLGGYLPERPPFTLDPRLHQGLYYVQDASSMVQWHVARKLSESLGPGLRWLDACAAPGGKTTAVCDALADDALIVANEFDPKRLQALIENVERWGAPNTVVTRGDTAQFSRLEGFFDVVAVDAPCSGEGMMRKEPEAVAQWTQRLVERCAELQREILENVWPALRPGGYLVYSTCTFNVQEDEGNVKWIIDTLGAEPVDLGLDALPGVVGAVEGNLPVGRFLPGRVRGEGLFIAVLRRPGEGRHSEQASKGIKTAAAPKWMPADKKYTLVPTREGLASWPTAHAGAIARLSAVTRVARAGVPVAELKGRDMVPTLALCRMAGFSGAEWPRTEVDYPTALAFLRGEALHLPEGTPRGIVLLTYGVHPLGWVKNLGNRANNLLPDNRRVRSQAVPDAPPALPAIEPNAGSVG